LPEDLLYTQAEKTAHDQEAQQRRQARSQKRHRKKMAIHSAIFLSPGQILRTIIKFD